jgi:hypothetical protein
MKNDIVRWMGKNVFVLTSVLALTSVCSAQTFGYSIPVDNPRIGVVKVTLEGAGGGQLTASGSNPAITCGTCFNFQGGAAFGVTNGATTNGTFIANDTVIGTSPSSPNDLMRLDSRLNTTTGKQDLVIQYIRRGHFNVSSTGGPDYCSPLATAAQTETITFTLTGATPTGYRINSYTVPGTSGSSLSAPVTAVDCSKAKRRVSVSADFGSTPPPGTNLYRHPLDVVMVLDKSGSMGTNDVQVGTSSSFMTRMQSLQQAAGEFVAQFGMADPHNTEGADRLALVFYDTVPTPASLTSANFITRTSGNWSTLNTTIQTTPPGGNTAMGPGLEVAITGWMKNSGADPNFDDATFVLLTDGLQNTGDLVTACPSSGYESLPNVCGPSVTCDTGNPSDPNSELFQCGIPTETLALSLAADHVLVDNISQQTAGVSEKAVTDYDLAFGFGDTLAALLAGNSESVLFHAVDTFTSSGGGGQLRPTLLDGSVERAMFVLGWQGGGQSALDLQIFPPGCTPPGCKPVPPVLRSDGPFWTVQSVDIPTTGPIGQWSVMVVQRVFNDVAAGRTAVVTAETAGIPYNLSGYSMDGKLSYRFTFAGIGQGTGDSISLQAQMSYMGKPLTGLGSALKVHVERPDTGEGTYLHDTQVSDAVLNTEIDPGDPTTPFERKIRYLLNNGNLKNVIQPKPIPTEYTLLDSANTGVYSAAIADTTRPGLYKFTVTMDWNVPTTGTIHRAEQIQRNVQVNATSAASKVTVKKGNNPGEWLINVTPRDQFGNYTGPGYGNAFNVQVSGGGAMSGGPADAKQTGAYVVTLAGVPSGADPKVVIKVQGKEIRNEKLSAMKQCDGLPFGAVILFPLGGIFIIGLEVYRPRKKEKQKQEEV